MALSMNADQQIGPNNPINSQQRSKMSLTAIEKALIHVPR